MDLTSLQDPEGYLISAEGVEYGLIATLTGADSG